VIDVIHKVCHLPFAVGSSDESADLGVVSHAASSVEEAELHAPVGSVYVIFRMFQIFE
jgi:hypothetical protein